jgi:predicted ATPase/DNA-binding SARP family transcriptional activator/Tfp pilus assembly protein PilF
VAARVRLQLFGTPRIERDGRATALPFERRSQLVALLALRGGWVGRAEIATMLWPGQAAKLAHANLRKTLFRLPALASLPAVESEGAALRLTVGTDVQAFEAALREQRRADALAVYAGELLHGFDDDANEAWSSWLGFERDRLRVAWRGAALEHLAGALEPAEGIALSAHLLAHDPLDEAALRGHMQWLTAGGQSAAARDAYHAFATRLTEELGVAPGAELKSLHDALHGAARRAASEPARPRAREDGFVGRVVELQRIAAQLAEPECRLLTLVGPGGVGKTRLAHRVRDEVDGQFPDGVVFASLEDASTAADLGAALARELGATVRGDCEDALVERLRASRTLLILDNLEHLAGQLGIVTRLLARCPNLKILATSRVRLTLPLEWTLAVEGLPCPEPEDADRLDAFDATRLFVATARRVEPALVPAAEAAAIVDICRQVDGLPLALELAATWTRVLSCSAIAAELRAGTELWHAADPGRPARHASMQVVFDQSWRLLAPQERDALARLTVFQGGFGIEAARAVTGAALPVLAALADKSLLRKDGARASLHPLVHQLGAQRLADDEAERTREAHARYFGRLVAESRHAINVADADAMRAMLADFENCRAAWRWHVAQRRLEALARCVATLLHFSDHHARIDDGLALLREALDACDASTERGVAPRIMSGVAHLEYRLDRYAVAEELARRALAACRSARDHDTRLQSHIVLGGCCFRTGRHEDARRHYAAALRESPAETDPHSAAAMLDNLALVEKAMGRYREALAMSVESLVQHRRLGDAAGEALCLNNLGALEADHGDADAADAHFAQGLAVCERHGLVGTRALILANASGLALKRGDVDAAGSYARRALEVAHATHNDGLVVWLRLQGAHIALHRRDLDDARAQILEALGKDVVARRPSLQLEAISTFAELLAAQGEPVCARRIFAFVANHPLMTPQGRADAQRRMAASCGPGGDDGVAWTGPSLDGLLDRIAVEMPVAHAPLIAAIRVAG